MPLPPIITVFASSSPRTPAAYLSQAAELGRLLVARGWRIRNGAGATGCMGALNDAALAAGGYVEGVILQKFLDDKLEHRGLAQLVVAHTMRERKRLLGHDADAVITLPGGPGTWEEFWELTVERSIGTHTKPLVLVNQDGFYDGFIATAQRAEREGLLYGPHHELFHTVGDVTAACAWVAGQLSVR